MTSILGCLLLLVGLPFVGLRALAQDQPDAVLKVFQFPADRIPRIDGDASDWAMVPESYVVDASQLRDDTKKHASANAKDLDVHVKVGWVKGLNRLYFLYEAYDNFWDFSDPGLHNDTFEVVVDGDLSGEPLNPRFRLNAKQPEADARASMFGTGAQNYHIFTPAEGKDWAMVLGCQPWIKELPYANHAQRYSFKHGESGRYTLEFWITPFDYAGCEGPVRAVESKLYEGKTIGLGWAVIDYDGAAVNNGFWNLSSQHTMYGIASQLRAFRLMPLEAGLAPGIAARWSFKVLDVGRRVVAFEDESVGAATWKWDFGDGSTSVEQHPVHAYKGAGDYVVVLTVTGPAGSSRLSKVWDVSLR
ncbi:PKD domain-containing protein [Granulicella rosea]|uniref:PKD domain-containing protein n=1 Tax=Granulicella rosea TaxID=474952 RepID=A0A239MF27_9BACT|nr:PKD domain-containing protein [Granulicella rosea]SNT41295.1 PKD domain-containing protein [Granulicella rosea]